MPLHDNEPGSDELEQTQPLGGVTAEDGDPFTDAGTNSFGGTDSMFDPDLVSPRVPASPAQAGGGAFQFQNLPFATPGNNFNLAHHLEARNQPDQFGQFNQFGQFGQFDQFDHFGQLGQFGQFNQFNQFPNPQTPFNNSHGNFGNMASLEPLLPQAASEASGQHHDPATPSPARITGQAGDMMSPRAQFMQATAATGDREQDFQADTPAHIPLNLAHFDERIYDPGLVDNPFENQGPAKTVQDAGLRVRFHIEKLNRLHAIRIADNDKISFNYFTQGNWVNESIVDYIAILSGVRLTSNLIAEYNDNPDPNSLFKIARFVRHALIPKLRDVGPQLKAYMEAIIRTIQDPQVSGRPLLAGMCNVLLIRCCSTSTAATFTSPTPSILFSVASSLHSWSSIVTVKKIQTSILPRCPLLALRTSSLSLDR